MSVVTTMSAATFADDTTEILNGQVNLNAAINAVVTTETDQADSATTTAIGIANALTVDVVTPHDIQSSQAFSGSVDTSATTTAQITDGVALTTSTAFGNTASILTDADMDVVSDQSAADGASVSSNAQLNVGSYSISSVTTATASANAYESIAYGGETNLDLRQDSGAAVTADAYVLAPDAGLGYGAAAIGAANGNSVLVEGYMGASQIVDVDQTNRGDVTGRVRMDAGGTAISSQAMASANGNAVRIQNEDGYAHLQGGQTNSGTVTADAEILVGNFDADALTVSAEGVGNSAIISNLGADAFMGLDQNNTGAVNARANFAGDAGGSVMMSATAFGNAATSYICSECPVTSYGDMNQVNGANVSSVVTGQMTTGQNISGTATAIGNSATFQTATGY